MNKELFVSSTPHETKVGLTEDDLLAEIYLERENEYTLAGSIYKGRVTRVLPGMQSAFVDIGLERDAFLYVSDFMELEEHDEDVTDVIPAGRSQLESRPVQTQFSAPVSDTTATVEEGSQEFSHEEFREGQSDPEHEAQTAGNASLTGESIPGADSQNRDRGGYRNSRRRRRGGRRDGRSDAGRSDVGRGDARGDRSDNRDRAPEPRFSRPTAEVAPPHAPEPVRAQQFGPPAGYEPILLPGESISKYQRLARPAVQVRPDESVISAAQSEVAEHNHQESAYLRKGQDQEGQDREGQREEGKREDQAAHEDPSFNRQDAADTFASTDWNREFQRADDVSAAASAPARIPEAELESLAPGATSADVAEAQASHTDRSEVERSDVDRSYVDRSDTDTSDVHRSEVNRSENVTRTESKDLLTPQFAAPGTIEEETIDEEEAETLAYRESSDESYDEFEEETRAAGQASDSAGQVNGDVREAVTEIHRAALSETHQAPTTAEDGQPEGEDDSEELELEEAQAEAEALVEAEARGDGTVDARVEVRGPATTAGYTQRAPRPAPGFDRRTPRGRRGGRRFRPQAHEVPKISELLKEGQEILVQIAKEPIGKKGARITSHIALPGRFLVYMPTVNHTGVSRKIASDEERQRLKRIVMSERDNGHGGFIVRTAAQSATEEELRADIRFLKGLWNDIKTRSESSKPPALIYHDLNVVERVLRDQVTSDFSVIWVDTEPEYERILRFFNRFQPSLVKRVKLYTKETPLFEQFGLADEMNKALKSKVWLKSGGYIVINQTEALVAIDINTGKYVGKTARLEDTIVKTNVDAIKEIVRQIRLRDLGGIIIIDFIDMDERRNRQRVMQALEEELRHDRAPSKVLQFNDFGLVAITRKRVKQSLERTIGAPCPYCQSTGYVKSTTTICNEIYVEMRKIARHLTGEDVMLRVNPDIAKELKANNGRLLNEMEELTKRTIIVKSDPALHQEQFDVN
ncbi:MAG TPA: Rne/Rng family ribonuclease [Candidatus Sulfotelmatobacter sp.]